MMGELAFKYARRSQETRLDCAVSDRQDVDIQDRHESQFGASYGRVGEMRVLSRIQEVSELRRLRTVRDGQLTGRCGGCGGNGGCSYCKSRGEVTNEYTTWGKEATR
jgi:hypothetical protein